MVMLPPKYAPSMSVATTEPSLVITSRVPVWMKYIFVPMLPSVMTKSPIQGTGKELLVVINVIIEA